MLVVNASNIMKDFNWIAEHDHRRSATRWPSTRARATRCIALQGPAARDVLQTLTGVDLARHQVLLVRDTARSRACACTISRTGYTGEDGFEVFVPPSVGRARLGRHPAGRARAGVVPAGLGARDTLRLEAAMRLYGNDIDETTTVLEADLGWIVGWKKGEFIGHEVLRAQKADGRAAQARRLRDGRPRHRPARLRRLRRRRRRPASSRAARRRRS